LARDEEDCLQALIEAEIPPLVRDPDAMESLTRLRLARERMGLSLSDVSERSGISAPALSRMERGQGNPTLETLYRIAEAMRMKLEWGLVEADATTRD
jgi:transcriptional regulator with XRE-family HTH domain